MEKMSRSGQTKGIPVGGIVKEIEKHSFYVDFRSRNRDIRNKRGVPESRVQKIINKKDNFFNLPTVPTQRVHLIYLTQNSLEGKYANPEFNLPYQIYTENGYEVYRQSIIETKEDILKKLENAELKI